MFRSPPRPPLFPYTTLFRSWEPIPDSGIVPAQSRAPHSAATRQMRHASASPPTRCTLRFQTIGPSSAKIWRSEEHTSELQSHHDLVCRLLLEKKKKKTQTGQ